MDNNNFKKILVVRTDRIGDLLLSTAAIKALREDFPKSHIAVMVGPAGRDIVLGNPYINQVIVYDKYLAQRSIFASIKFALKLRREKFDLALILHPTNRVHLVAFLAGINKRVGYNRKLGFLLTDKIKHKKQEGTKHEIEYTLDVIRYLGIKAEQAQLFMPIREDSEQYIRQFFISWGLKEAESIVAFHPSASCRSKLWPVERFAKVADVLTERLKIKTIIVTGPNDQALGKQMAALMRTRAIDASGLTSVSQLASLLKRCRLFISNDSGPVHIASAVGAKVLVIFGRNQPGLSPRRWGPSGRADMVLHKDVGCSQCLAHDCQKGFICLEAVTAEEVIDCAEKMLRR